MLQQIRAGTRHLLSGCYSFSILFVSFAISPHLSWGGTARTYFRQGSSVIGFLTAESLQRGKDCKQLLLRPIYVTRLHRNYTDTRLDEIVGGPREELRSFSIKKGGVGENLRFAPCSPPDLSRLSNFKKRSMTT